MLIIGIVGCGKIAEEPTLKLSRVLFNHRPGCHLRYSELLMAKQLAE
jgi:hypothetical protein